MAKRSVKTQKRLTDGEPNLGEIHAELLEALRQQDYKIMGVVDPIYLHERLLNAYKKSVAFCLEVTVHDPRGPMFHNRRIVTYTDKDTWFYFPEDSTK